MDYFTNANNGVLVLVSAIPQSEFFGSIVSGKSENTATAIKEQDALNWVKNDSRRMLHVVYRVGDLEKTIKYALS